MLILPAQGSAVLYLQRDNEKRVRIASAIFAVFLLVLPLFFIEAPFFSANAGWIAAGIGPPGLRSLREVAVSFAGARIPPRIRQRLLEALFAIGFCMYLGQLARAARVVLRKQATICVWLPGSEFQSRYLWLSLKYFLYSLYAMC
jgi:hypothetical protein